MGKFKVTGPVEARNCHDCDLWWWVEKNKLEARMARISAQPVIQGDFKSNWSRYMSLNIGHQVSCMNLEEFKAWHPVNY